MKVYRHALAMTALSAFIVIPACADEISTPTDDGPGIAVTIGAVTYNGATDVCYGMAVHNTAGQLVVKLDHICASNYGNAEGGDIAYVAPCDASGTGASTVTLWLENIVIGGTATVPAYEAQTNYINPCGLNTLALETDNVTPLANDWPTAPLNYDGFTCQKQVTCAPNADTKVSFNLTVMRDAQQGFFDVVVDFEDIFCAAKLDTCYVADGTHIQLLQDSNAATPGRDDTMVMALACTAGPDVPESLDPEGRDITTTLHFSAIGVVCDGQIAVPLDPTGGNGLAGNKQTSTYFDLSSGVPVEGAFESPVHYALYWGTESLPCGFTEGGAPISCNKKYWNVALDLEDLEELELTNCVMHATATATGDGLSFVNGGLSGDGVTYPAINYVEQVIDTAGQSTCDYNPLNGDNSDTTDQNPRGSGVQTAYFGAGDITGLPKLPPICYNKNTFDINGQPTGQPWYTVFKDRNDFKPTTYEAIKGGRVGAGKDIAIGGDHRGNCYQSAKAFNLNEAVAFDVPTGIDTVSFELTAKDDFARAELKNLRAEVWGRNATGWVQLQAVAADSLKGNIDIGVGTMETALALRYPAQITEPAKEAKYTVRTFGAALNGN